MGDVTRPAPGSLGGGANESAVGGRRRGAREEVQECAASLEAGAGGRGLRLRPAPPLPGRPERPGLALRALLLPRAEVVARRRLDPGSPPTGARPAGPPASWAWAGLGSIGFPLLSLRLGHSLKKKGKPNKTCPCR